MYKSQWKQDKWLNENAFLNKKRGFFVDIGAHDGKTINNTFFFEKCLDWEGICMEPIPKVFQELNKNRNVICINACAYNEDCIVEFAEIEGYSEMLSGVKTDYNEKHKDRISREVSIRGGKIKKIYPTAYSLRTIFSVYDVKHVDYLSIDTEGTELKVLQGINFDKVNIDYIEVEINYEEDRKQITSFLQDKGYEHLIDLGGDVIYRRKKSIKYFCEI